LHGQFYAQHFWYHHPGGCADASYIPELPVGLAIGGSVLTTDHLTGPRRASRWSRSASGPSCGAVKTMSTGPGAPGIG
jgi:hypothetical protein